MSILRDIKIAQKEQLDTREEKIISFPAIVVKVGDSIHVENRSMHIWVYEQGKASNVLAVLNLKVSAVEGLSVLVREGVGEDKELQVWGLYTASLDMNSNGGANFNLPLHSQNHQYRTETEIGVDSLPIFQPALMPLKTVDNGDLNITVLEHRFIYEGVNYYFSGETVDLTSYVPITSGKHSGGLIYLDVISNTIQVVFNDPINTIIPVSFPAIPTNSIPSSHIILTYNQTAISLETDVQDLRNFLQVNNSQVPAPEEKGDLLVSDNGSSWSRGLVVTDCFGELIVDTEGRIITT